MNSTLSFFVMICLFFVVSSSWAGLATVDEGLSHFIEETMVQSDPEPFFDISGITEFRARDLWKDRSNTLQSRWIEIPLCWGTEGGNRELMDFLIGDLMKDYVNSQFERAGIRFTGWTNCYSSAPKKSLRLLFKTFRHEYKFGGVGGQSHVGKPVWSFWGGSSSYAFSPYKSRFEYSSHVKRNFKFMTWVGALTLIHDINFADMDQRNFQRVKDFYRKAFRCLKKNPNLKGSRSWRKRCTKNLSVTVKNYKGTWNRKSRRLEYASTKAPSKELIFTNTVVRAIRITLHELGHAVGLRHEHQRPDVPVKLWAPKCQFVFDKKNAKKRATKSYLKPLKLGSDMCLVGEPDFHSIMSYCTRPLVLSEGDIKTLKTVYFGNPRREGLQCVSR